MKKEREERRKILRFKDLELCQDVEFQLYYEIQSKLFKILRKIVLGEYENERKKIKKKDVGRKF